MKWAMGLLLFLLLLARPAAAPADVVTLKDGSRYEGLVVYEGEDKVHLKMEIGVIKFNRAEVARIDKISVEPSPAEVKKDTSLPFPAAPAKKAKAPTKPKKGKPVAPVIEEEAEIQEPTEEDVLQEEEKQHELDIKEKELELKRQELDIRRQELELKKREQTAPAEQATPKENIPVETQKVTPTVKPATLKEVEEEPAPAEEEKAEKKKEEEDTKVKGVEVGPQIRGTGRYKTY